MPNIPEVILDSKLVDEINATFQDFEKSSAEAIKTAIKCGKLLRKAKMAVPHGEWLSWVDENLKFGHRQAQRLMRLVAYEETFLSNATPMSHLTIESALKMVSNRKLDAKKSEPKESLNIPVRRSGPMAALKNDLSAIRNRTTSANVLDAISTIMMVDMTAKQVVELIEKPNAVVSIRDASEMSIAWLSDFVSALEGRIKLTSEPLLQIVSPED